MSSDAKTVSVKILDKEYQVACPPEEVEALTASARYLDEQMATIRDSGKVFGLDRIAVMAALNIANEYIRNRDLATNVTRVPEDKVTELTQRVSQVLAQQKQLNL